MAKKKKKELSGFEKRRLRSQQIVLIAIGLIVIISMIMSLVSN